MGNAYFSGELVYLRAVEPEDLEVLYSLENDPRMWNVSNFTVPYSKYALKHYIESSAYDMFADRQLRLVIVSRQEGVVAGTVDITDFVPLHARGEVGVAVLKEYQGRGYATEALQLLCNYAFRFLFFRQLVAHVVADNTTCLHVFTSCGFEQCGYLKAWWMIEGEPRDVLLLQCINKGMCQKTHPRGPCLTTPPR
ncbi:MAG: GNAT family N-acetyltransferase [Prevotellaceae bacterium]|nr:GNAT family N-acetyltransferase [Prevotellaceae bacterium]